MMLKPRHKPKSPPTLEMKSIKVIRGDFSYSTKVNIDYNIFSLM